ncbi:MAG: LapA family protein [Deltaproteobacteria bacterium]
MRYLKYLFLIVVGLVLITLAVTNRESVTVRLLPEGLGNATGFGFTATMPLFVVIFAALLAGVILGFVWEWFREHKFRVEAATKKKEATKLRAEVSRLKSVGRPGEDEIIALLENR